MFSRLTIRAARAAGLILAAAAALFFCPAPRGHAAELLAAGGLGESPFADGETSATFALPQTRERNWRLHFILDGNAGNRAEIAFGRSADAGLPRLGSEEVVAVVAWEQGVWRVTGGAGLEERYEAAPAGKADGAADTLRLDIRFGGDGAAESAAFRRGGVPFAFGGLSAAPPPPWLDPRRWNTACVTTRGFAPRVEAHISESGDGTRVILR